MKHLIITMAFILGLCQLKSQTAVDFSANDCNNNNHSLFNELDAGKVVILCWVMPCSSCIAPALAIQANIQSYSNSNPGIIKYYICDDYANTTCTTLQGWCNTNGINSISACFSNSNIKMSDYGGAAMPKTVILAGASHSVFLVQDGVINNSTFNSALSQAMNEALTTGIKPPDDPAKNLLIYPNPADENFCIKNLAGDDKVEIFDSLGEKIFLKSNPERSFDVSGLASGIYTIRINEHLSRLVISH